jgi:hypothetical protein
MVNYYDIGDFAVGHRVRAFHPRRFGVVNTGEVVKIGRKWLYVDFGPLLGGTFKVSPAHVVERMGRQD